MAWTDEDYRAIGMTPPSKIASSASPAKPSAQQIAAAEQAKKRKKAGVFSDAVRGAFDGTNTEKRMKDALGSEY